MFAWDYDDVIGMPEMATESIYAESLVPLTAGSSMTVTFTGTLPADWTDTSLVGIGLSTYDSVDVGFYTNLPYTDVIDYVDAEKASDTAWYLNPVSFMYVTEVMTGYEDGSFAPEADLSRGDIVTMLWRIAGEEEMEYDEALYTDVEEGAYYETAAMWANETGIMTGLSEGTFGYGNETTREEIATILYRYASALVESGDLDEGALEATDDLSSFSDAASVSSYAEKAMQWAVGSGIISGNDDGTLAPGRAASRAEIAAMTTRYLMTY